MRLAQRNDAAFPAGTEESILTTTNYTLEIWQFISILLSALVTGVFWGTWLGLSRSMAALTPATFLEVGHTMIANLGIVMAILTPAAILAVLPVLYLLYRERSRPFYLTLAAFVLFVVALLITLIVEVPIDNQIEGWTVATLPANWQQLRDRWEWFHFLRSWVSVLGLALLLGGALFTRKAVTVKQPAVDRPSSSV
jgi:uncharacterized membrane protein